MSHRRPSPLPSSLTIAIAILIAGCGGSATVPSSSSPAATAPLATSGAAPSAAPSSSATQTAAPSGPAGAPSLPAIFSSHADPALEAQLPTEVSATALGRYSQALSDVLDAGGDRAAIDAFLRGIGKTEADGSVAAAYDPTNTLKGAIIAYKVNGADTATLLNGIVSLEQSDLGPGATKKQATVGGKNVTVVSVGTGVNDTEWLYGRGDAVFVVHAADEAHAAAYLQALP
jgi:hypothetical protein